MISLLFVLLFSTNTFEPSWTILATAFVLPSCTTTRTRLPIHRLMASRNYDSELDLYKSYADSLGSTAGSSSNNDYSMIDTRSNMVQLREEPPRTSTLSNQVGHKSYRDLLRSMNQGDATSNSEAVSIREPGGALTVQGSTNEPRSSNTAALAQSNNYYYGGSSMRPSPMAPYANYGTGYYSPYTSYYGGSYYSPYHYGGGDYYYSTSPSGYDYYNPYGNKYYNNRYSNTYYYDNQRPQISTGPQYYAQEELRRPRRKVVVGDNNQAARYGQVVSGLPRSIRRARGITSYEDISDYGTITGTLRRRRANSSVSRQLWARTRLAPTEIQGSSLKTWSVASGMDHQVLLKTQGRPLNALVEIWQGPGHTPHSVKVFLEDGGLQTFALGVPTPSGRSGTVQHSISVRNTGTMEFPLQASVEPDQGQGISAGLKDIKRGYYPTESLQGNGGVRTYSVDPEIDGSVAVLLQSENGRPLKARIELLNGPNNAAQSMEVYSEEGLELPIYTVIDTTTAPGQYQTTNSIRIVNTGPLEFPISVSVAPFSF